LAEQLQAAEHIARQISTALEAADLSAFSELLDPHVRWGAPDDPSPACQNRDQVMSWYHRGKQEGVQARVTETVVCGDRILVGLRVAGRPASAHSADEAERWQVLTVRGGRVVDIVGFDDRGDAAARAGLAPGPSQRPEAMRWTEPGHDLADDRVRLRLPVQSDSQLLHAYASRDDGMEGVWVPLAAGASLESCVALIDDWLAGWRNDRSFHGPALVIEEARGSAMIGQVGLADRGGRIVELVYGVAPPHRGRGYATRAARLAARWLLSDGLASTVELRIGEDDVASQRVAAAAGFVPAGTVKSHVPATGDSYNDLRFVLPAP
jgi:RimJ/RimL family protein N-acetyltransferase